MFLDRLLNQGSTPVLEQMLQFTDARQRLLAEDVANVSTPDYVQKDLSLDQFQEILQQKVQEQESAAPGSVNFDDVSMDIQQPQRGILFHDGNNRSMEQLMSDQAKNALMHNMAVELLRDQYSMIETALKEGK
jgi:flagellar basal-body rod protein FlgB